MFPFCSIGCLFIATMKENSWIFPTLVTSSNYMEFFIMLYFYVLLNNIILYSFPRCLNFTWLNLLFYRSWSWNRILIAIRLYNILYILAAMCEFKCVIGFLAEILGRRNTSNQSGQAVPADAVLKQHSQLRISITQNSLFLTFFQLMDYFSEIKQRKVYMTSFF